MGLKEQLKEKIYIDKLYNSILEKIRKYGGKIAVAKDFIRELLKKADYEGKEIRDLKIYTCNDDILVLDNELPIYRHTTVEDIAMRRSPTLGEMISLRNIKRILTDSDIVFKKGLDSLYYLYNKVLSRLDLTVTPAEMRQIVEGGISAYRQDESAQVWETIELIFEILTYKEVGAELRLPPYLTYGIPEHNNGKRYRDLVIITPDYREIKLIKGSFLASEMNTVFHLTQVALGKEKADIEGANVFIYWGEQALKLPSLAEPHQNN